jgi:GMP synthase (glutamine-hydrolysing)
MKPLVILRAGDAAAPVAERRGQFPARIQREVGTTWAGGWVEHDIRIETTPLPDPRSAAGFIITGSSSSITERAPWILRAEDLVRRIHDAGTPLFGICFGHQMVGQALGGQVTKNPKGREIGTVRVRLKPGAAGEPILAGLPSAFTANHTHVDSVTTLPPGARVLGETDLEPNAIFVVGTKTKCVQFHPEIDGDAMRGYLSARAEIIESEGLDAKGMLARAVDTPDGAATLRNFVKHVVCAS